jgi:hypothetical protein
MVLAPEHVVRTDWDRLILTILLIVPLGRNDKCGVRTSCSLGPVVLSSVIGDAEPKAEHVLASVGLRVVLLSFPDPTCHPPKVGGEVLAPDQLPAGELGFPGTRSLVGRP